MAYTVNKTNSSATPNSYTVQDSILNTQTDISFIGKGYAGYGEIVAENFLHLLENFSNTSAPSKPIKGQLWFDESEGRLKVYNGSSFNPLGGARYQSSTPASQTQGDLWIDSDTGQLYFYNGTSNVLVGPPTSTGTTQGFTYETITDTVPANQNIINLYSDGDRIAIISKNTFTPQAGITGFPSIRKGINLFKHPTDATLDAVIKGKSTDSDALGGVAAANYLRSDTTATAAGPLTISSTSGLTIGAATDFKFYITGAGDVNNPLAATIQNTITDRDIQFIVNDGGNATTVMTIDGATSRIGIGTATPTTALDVSGTVKATAFTGNITGDVTGSVTGGTGSFSALTITGTTISQTIRPSVDATYNLGTASFGYNTVYAKATSAQYADLAENYETDDDYAVGTVVMVGGNKEVTASSFGKRAIGVVSENPAYLMNSTGKGQPIALKGKVKVRVSGFIAKGDELIADNNGTARRVDANFKDKVFAIALENNADSDAINLIECIVL
jgi:hypothetical protein